jgi:hypothetical protein
MAGYSSTEDDLFDTDKDGYIIQGDDADNYDSNGNLVGGGIADTGGNHGAPALAGPAPAKDGFDISSFLTGIGGAAKEGKSIFDSFSGKAIPTTNANATKPAAAKSKFETLFGGLNPTMVYIIIGAALFFLWRRR